MNSKYILLVIALVPVAIHGMDQNPDLPEAPDAHIHYKTAHEMQEKLAAAHDNNNHFLSSNVKQSLDNLIDPHHNKPSFFNRFGNQFGLGIALTCASLMTAMLVKKYLTPKSEKNREDAQTTATEQTILNNLKSEIQELSRNLPLVQQRLATETCPEQTEYLKTLIYNGQELLQKKIVMLETLSKQFNENQEHRYADQLRNTNATRSPAPTT